MAAHQTSPSLGFSRQEHWNGLPFPSPMHESESESEVSQSCLTLATPWTAAYQAPLSMGLPRQKYWSGAPLPSPFAYYLSEIPFFPMWNSKLHPTEGWYWEGGRRRVQAMQETWVWSLGHEGPLKKGKATQSSTLAWRIPWTEQPGRLQSIGSFSSYKVLQIFWVPLPMQETQEMRIRSLGWKDPLEKEMATHSSILNWKIPWTE